MTVNLKLFIEPLSFSTPYLKSTSSWQTKTPRSSVPTLKRQSGSNCYRTGQGKFLKLSNVSLTCTLIGIVWPGLSNYWCFVVVFICVPFNFVKFIPIAFPDRTTFEPVGMDNDAVTTFYRFHRMGVINKRMKTPFYSIMDHLVYKNSLKVLLTLISGDEHGLNFTWEIIII